MSGKIWSATHILVEHRGDSKNILIAFEDVLRTCQGAWFGTLFLGDEERLLVNISGRHG
jgi:hypothetical protein